MLKSNLPDTNDFGGSVRSEPQTQKLRDNRVPGTRKVAIYKWHQLSANPVVAQTVNKKCEEIRKWWKWKERSKEEEEMNKCRRLLLPGISSSSSLEKNIKNGYLWRGKWKTPHKASQKFIAEIHFLSQRACCICMCMTAVRAISSINNLNYSAF